MSRGSKDGTGWMAMIKSRNQSSHTYTQEIADQICQLIIGRYQALLTNFEEWMQNLKETR